MGKINVSMEERNVLERRSFISRRLKLTVRRHKFNTDPLCEGEKRRSAPRGSRRSVARHATRVCCSRFLGEGVDSWFVSETR